LNDESLIDDVVAVNDSVESIDMTTEENSTPQKEADDSMESTTPKESPPPQEQMQQQQQQQPQARTKDIIEFRKADRDRLAPGEWLNDSMIDLWLRWISQTELGQTDKR